MPCHEHEDTLLRLEQEYQRKGYSTIINTADIIRIPDLLMISKTGSLLWIEVEWVPSLSKNIKFKVIRKLMSDLGGIFRVVYLTLDGKKYTSIGKRVANIHPIICVQNHKEIKIKNLRMES